jgi:hypothetical protein
MHSRWWHACGKWWVVFSTVIGKGVGQLPMNPTCSLRGHPAIWLQNWLAANHATGWSYFRGPRSRTYEGSI